MADATKNLQVVITSDTTQPQEDIAAFSGTLNGLNTAIAGIGLGMLAQQIANLGVQSVQAASDFQSSMEQIQTQALQSKSEVNNMTQAIMDMSSQVGTGPQELAQGLYHIESAGYSGAKALEILRTAAEGAAVGHANLEDVTNALVGAQASGISGFKNMSQAMGVLNAIVGSGNMRMQDLVDAMSSGILPVAKQFGISIQDVGAALATLTDNGIPAADASTRLSHTLSLIGAQTPAAQKALADIGIQTDQLGDDMRNGGLVKALEDLKSHLEAVQPATESVVKGTKMSASQLQSYQEKIKTTSEQIQILQEEHVKAGVATDKHNLALEKAQNQLAQYQEKVSGANQVVQAFAGGQLSATQQTDILTKAFGGGRNSAVILTLLGNLDRVKTKYDDITGATNKFADAWVETQATSAYQIAQFQGNIQKLEVEFGSAFLPVLSNVLGVINSHQEAFAILAGILSGVFVVALAGATVAAIALLAPLLAITITIGALTAPIWLVGLAIGALVAVVVSAALIIAMHWKDITGFFESMWKNSSKFMQNLEKDISGAFKKIVKDIGDGLENAKNAVTSKLKDTKTAWDNYNSYLVTLHQKQKAESDKFWTHDLIFSVFLGLGWLSVEIPKTFNNIVKWFEDLPKNTEKSMKNLHDSTIQWWSKTQTDSALALYKMSTDVSNAFQKSLTDTTNWMQQTWKSVTGWWSKTQSDAALWLYQMTTDVSNIIGQIPTIVHNILKQLNKTVDDDLSIVSKTASKWWTTISGFFQNIINKANEAIQTASKGFSAGQSAAGVQHRAMGGPASGLTLVGENGPELVNLPGGSYVHSNSDSQKMMSGVSITINYPQLTSQQNVNQLIYDIKRALGRDAELAKLGAL